MKLHRVLRDVELAGDLFVGEILEQRIENFLLPAAEIGDGIGLQAAALTGENGVDKSGKELPRNPESSGGNQRERADQLLTSFDVGEKAFHAGAQKRKTVGVVVLFADDDKPGLGMTFQEIGQERAG